MIVGVAKGQTCPRIQALLYCLVSRAVGSLHKNRPFAGREPRDPPGVGGGVLQRHHAAHGVPDQEEAVEPERSYRLTEILRVTRVRVVGRPGPFAVAVTAQVDRLDVEVGNEIRSDEVEPVGVRSAAVHAQHRLFPRRSVVQQVQAQAAGLEESAGGG